MNWLYRNGADSIYWKQMLLNITFFVLLCRFVTYFNYIDKDGKPTIVHLDSHRHSPPPPPYIMMSSNGNIFRVTGHLCGEFTGTGEFPAQKPVTRSFDVFFDLHPNKRLSKQRRGWWFETPSCPLWRHRNVYTYILFSRVRQSKIKIYLFERALGIQINLNSNLLVSLASHCHISIPSK